MTQAKPPTFNTFLDGVVLTPKLLGRIAGERVHVHDSVDIKFNMLSPKGVDALGEASHVAIQISDLSVSSYPDDLSLSEALEQIRNNSVVIGVEDGLTFEMLNSDGLKAVASTSRVDVYATEIRNERLGTAILRNAEWAFASGMEHNQELRPDSLKAKAVLPHLLAEASRRTGIKWSGEVSEAAIKELASKRIFEILVDPKRPRGPIDSAPEVASEPVARGHKRTGPRVPEPKAAEPKAAEPKAAEPKAAEPKAAEPKAAEPKAAEPKAAEWSSWLDPSREYETSRKAAEPKPVLGLQLQFMEPDLGFFG